MRFFRSPTTYPISDLATQGRGFMVKGNKFVHHSNLRSHDSAAISVTSSQKLFLLTLLLLLSLLLYLDWFHTVSALIILLTTFYFLDLLFGLFLAYRSFSRNPEISISDAELANLELEDLPNYTIFCPLYKEWRVLPQFVGAMESLDYPKDKLQIMLQLEEDDTQTILQAYGMDLPEYFQIVVVPNSKPKTKPKAMNYGLQFATGDIVTIYDAEDVPDPLQLKKVVAAFRKLPDNVICVQGKLNFYNPYQNLLTRMFTAEYSLWFDLILPGMQTIGAPIPLGGTSNHFKKTILHQLAGWDAYNVTEDCDLGLRLAKRGYRTAIVDSTTLEEANSGYHNWYRQRSRWIKGYMQTYLVHMRKPRQALRQFGLKNLLLMQLTIGGKVLSAFINPFLWVVTVSYFVFRSQVAPIIEPLFPPVVLYLGVASLIFGNFFYAYAYLIGLAKRKEYGVMKYVFFVPLYWLFISVAAWKALYELIVKPHYWQKTNHGLHLQEAGGIPNSQFPIPNERQGKASSEVEGEAFAFKENNQHAPTAVSQVAAVALRGKAAKKLSVVSDIVGEVKESIASSTSVTAATPDAHASRLTSQVSVWLRIPAQGGSALKNIFVGGKDKGLKILSLLGFSYLSGGPLLISAMLLANFLNFLFSATLGRRLAPEDFGTLGLFSTVILLVGVVTGGLGGSITYKIARFIGSHQKKLARPFLALVGRQWWIGGLVAATAWVVVTPVLARFFHIADQRLVLAFAPLFPIMISQGIWSGFLRGDFAFKLLAFGVLADPVCKLLVAGVLVTVGRTDLVPLAIPAAVTAGWLTVLFLGKRKLAQAAVSNETRDLSEELNSDSHVSSLTSQASLAVSFPRKYFFSALLAGGAGVLFLTADVLFVKHYFDPVAAGGYALLSLCGNMIFYLCGLPSVFITTVVSREKGAGRDPRQAFLPLFRLVIATAAIGFVGVGLLGAFTVPLLFGSNAAPIVPYLITYTAALSIMAVCSSYISYRLAKDDFRYAWFGIAGAAVMSVGIALRHGSIAEVAQVVLFASSSMAVAMAGFHALERHGRYVLRNLIDLFDVFAPLPGTVAASIFTPPSSPLERGRTGEGALRPVPLLSKERLGEVISNVLTTDNRQPTTGAKRILIFNWRDTKHTQAGGAEVYVHEMAKRWAASGHTVTLFCGSDGLAPKFERLDGVNVIRRGGFYMVYVWAFLYYMLRLRGKFDVVVDSDSALPFFTPLYVREPVVGLVHHVHQKVFATYLRWPFAQLAQLLENTLMPFVYRHTRFLAVSESTKVDMEELGLGRVGIEVINPGVDMVEFVPGRKDAHPLVVFVGRLKAYKSVDVLVRAFELLHLSHPEARLVIAGSGEEESELKMLSKRLKLSGVVSFLGKVEEDLKVFLMQQAWVFANPSGMEGWGITSIEANACGTPVVASNVPGLRDSVQNPHTGYLVEYGNPAAFAEKIGYLLSDTKQRRFMEKESLDWAARFNWDDQAARALRVIL